MYNAHKITDKVAAGKLAIGSHVGFDSPFVTEMIAGCGFDFIWIDGEHSAIDRKDIQNHLMACRAAGAAGIVRVPWNDPVIIKAILDMGADGIVVPMVCSLEEAKQAAAAMTMFRKVLQSCITKMLVYLLQVTQQTQLDSSILLQVHTRKNVSNRVRSTSQ